MIIEKNTSFHFFRVNKYSTMSPKPKNNTKSTQNVMKNINFFQTIFLCYYHFKFFASEPFFIEEIEEIREVKSKYGKTENGEKG